MDATSFEDFITALPKVELHVHLEGSMQPATLLALADKHRIGDLRRSPDEIRSWYAFHDFPHFLEVYRNALRVLRDEDDFALLAAEAMRALARQNVRHAEVNFSLCDHLERGITAEVVFAGLERGRAQVEAEHDITVRWIPDFPGDFGIEAGESTLDAVLARGPASVLGLSIGGLEVDRRPFADLFARARAHGLRSLPHAGETEGPDRVWAALHDLGADRIGHGIASVDDPALVRHLRAHQIPLDVSPTSNLCTRAVTSLDEHPLPRMLEQGLLVTLNSDDPPMFGTDLTGEYRTAGRMGLDRAALTGLARNGVRASFLEPPRKTALLAEIDTTLARHDAPAPRVPGTPQDSGTPRPDNDAATPRRGTHRRDVRMP